MVAMAIFRDRLGTNTRKLRLLLKPVTEGGAWITIIPQPCNTPGDPSYLGVGGLRFIVFGNNGSPSLQTAGAAAVLSPPAEGEMDFF